VAGLEVGPVQPALEVLLRAPARQHEADLAVVVRTQQLEGLEALRARDATGAGGEALLELLEALARDGDGVDLDDAHMGSLILLAREQPAAGTEQLDEVSGVVPDLLGAARVVARAAPQHAAMPAATAGH